MTIMTDKTLTDDEVLQQYRRLVPWVYHRIRGTLHPGLEVEDYLQEGYVALWLAWREWNPGRAQFTSYATVCITNAMRMAARHMTRHTVPAIPWDHADPDGPAMQDLVPDPHAAEAFTWAEWSTVDWTGMAREVLSPTQYRVWATALAHPDRTQTRLGEMLAVSQFSVSRALRQAQDRLKAVWQDPPRSLGRTV